MEAGIVDPEKTSIAKQRHGNVSAVTNNHPATEDLLKAVFFYVIRAEAT
jgi:hypothetical protein